MKKKYTRIELRYKTDIDANIKIRQIGKTERCEIRTRGYERS